MKELNRWLSWWYKDITDTKYSEDYWRVRLIYHSLLSSCCVFLLLMLINVFVFSEIAIALIDGAGAIVSLGVYVFFRRTESIKLTAWFLSITVTFAMLLFLFYVDGLAYSLVWATIIPPFTYFLLGRAGGTVLSVITFIACIYLVRMQYESALPLIITKGALFNVIEAAVVQVLLFRFYEGTRHKAFLQLKAEHKESKRRSETDYLTGAFNRGKFFSLVTELLAKNSANEHCLVILDIDDFKCVNDKFGHDVGDSVLKMFTQTLKTQIRDKDILARWGGEEFVLLLTNVSSYDAQRRIEAILELLTLNNGSYGPISFSAGITPCQRGVPLGHLIKYADTALYRAKNSGKGRVIIYSGDREFATQAI